MQNVMKIYRAAGLGNSTRPLVFTRPQAAGQVEILIILVKIIIFLYMPIVFVMQGKCLFSDISRPGLRFKSYEHFH